MSRQDAKSCDCTKSELDLFSIPPTQTSVEAGNWIETHPITTLSDRGPIEFDIPGNGTQYFDLANVYLHVNAPIKKADGTHLGVDNYPGPINNWLHSLFEELRSSWETQW